MQPSQLLRTWTGRISLVCVLVFFAAQWLPAGQWLDTWCAIDLHALHGQAWRLFTYALIHFGVMHLLLNLIAFVSFGLQLERGMPTYRYLATIIWGTVFGAAGHLVQLLLTHGTAEAVGLSAAVCAVMTFWCMEYPDRQILLLFFPIRARWAIPLFIAISVFCLATGYLGNIGHGAHLAGMLAGYLCFKGWIVK